MLREVYFYCPKRDYHAVHYIYKRGERGVFTLVLCSLAIVTSCINASVRIVTKSLKVGPLLIFSISLVAKLVARLLATDSSLGSNPDISHIYKMCDTSKGMANTL